MKKSLLILLGFLIFGFYLVASTSPVTAAPAIQYTPFPTPTPGPDGRILYTVVVGDTLSNISSVSGLTVDGIRALNPEISDIIYIGQVIMLGLGGPIAEPTSSLPTPLVNNIEATPTIGQGTAIVCVLLFNDINGDSLREESEVSIAGGAVSITERTGLYSDSTTTIDGAEPYCFENVPEGDYNISVGIPEGYNPTTTFNVAIQINSGDETFLNFGAQEGSRLVVSNPTVEDGGRSPLFGLLGIALVLVGIGLGYYSFRMGRR